MCGILFQYHPQTIKFNLSRYLSTLTHRGPDFSGECISNDHKCWVGHTRLAIINPESGSQPFQSDNIIMTVNGEIYNYQLLQEKYNLGDRELKSDCEIILRMFSGTDFNLISEKLNQILGMFAFGLYNQELKTALIARDPLGIIPLYYGQFKGSWCFASELKALVQARCENIQEFPPGHYLTITEDSFKFTQWFYLPKTISLNFSLEELRSRLIQSVESHLMSDVPYAILLSGGLDSSIIASIVRYLKPYHELHTFSVGLKDSPDLIYAKKMADHLRTHHHEIIFTVEEAIKVLSEVIQSIETYDTTTIRASVPMYLMAHQIKVHGFKMVLSGEGADELFGGYLYFKKAPSQKEFHSECLQKTSDLHYYDLLRANKSMMAWGVEVRVPFLDTQFVKYALEIDPKHKMCRDRIEKHILREAFKDLLHPEIYARQKEQFSDGVGYSWIDSVKEYASTLKLDEEYEINPPRTDEEKLYRKIFSSYYQTCEGLIPWGFTIACSSSKVIEWDKDFKDRLDASGRKLDHHIASITFTDTTTE